MLKVPPDRVPRQVWTPRGRTPGQLRIARVKVAGSLILLVLLLAAVMTILM